MYVDGPYIFERGNHLIEKNYLYDAETGEHEVREIIHHLNGSSIFIKSIGKEVDVSKAFVVDPDEYYGVEKIAAFGDIHGEFDLLVHVLKSNRIVDDQLKWSFGKGHLVFCGDIFDRGNQVTECLWLIYSLEKEAKYSGGKVHYLLGNHEIMTLDNDVRYLSKKYLDLIDFFKIFYSELFGEDTTLGRWLRSKNTVIKINNHLFVHGGLSPKLLQIGYRPNEINHRVRQGLSKKERDNILFGSDGPLWYRGYLMNWFTTNKVTQKDVDEILEFFQTSKIIFAHTPVTSIETIFEHLIAIDITLAKGFKYQFLVIENESVRIVDAGVM